MGFFHMITYGKKLDNGDSFCFPEYLLKICLMIIFPPFAVWLDQHEKDYPGLKFCGIWIFKPKEARKQVNKINDYSNNLKSSPNKEINLPPPASISGTCHYKCIQKGHLKLKWVEIYINVKEPGTLIFAKDEYSAENNIIESYLPSPLDLSLVLDFSAITKDGKEGYRLKIELIDDCIKLRFDDEEDVHRFAKGLNEWKEHCLTLDMIRGHGSRSLKSPDYNNNDIEQGGGGNNHVENNIDNNEMNSIEMTPMTKDVISTNNNSNQNNLRIS